MRTSPLSALLLIGLSFAVPMVMTPADAAAQDVAAAVDANSTAPSLVFSGGGPTAYGDWRADVSVVAPRWAPGESAQFDVTLQIGSGHLASMIAAGIKVDKLCVLVTAERTFDADGWMRLPSDERMSTLLTPTGLAIEGGIQGAVTNRFGYQFGSPVDLFLTVPTSALTAGASASTKQVRFSIASAFPADFPPGLYRLRVDLGVMAGTTRYNLNGYSFASRPFAPDVGTYFYSPVVVPVSGRHASGRYVNANAIRPRFPWVLLANYNSNGYQGVVADEDRARFALSNRSIIPDEVILPLYTDSGSRYAYSLEPQFVADGIDTLQNIPWNWSAGELSVTIVGPDGARVSLGPAKFVAKSGNGPTTRNAAFTAWQPHMYGRYTVTATGWIEDTSGRRYQGGGTYRFWIAKRMTLATATFQGMPYPVGSTYGRDTQFNPAVPADVTVTAWLYPNSDPARVKSLSYSGKASPAGLFGAAQGMKAFPLDAPGEYHAQVLATYTDAEGHLWVSTMRHAGIVYAEPSAVIARGKKFAVAGKYVERGDTKFEGYVDANGENHLAHLTFPYLAGDVLLVGAEGQGANKIEPVLTYQLPGDTSAWDTSLNGVGTTNLRIRTSNGYSPHLYPEYITAMEYYYGAAPRPGFMGRFIVGESNVRAPYWPVSPNSFGGQIGASPNGDAPGDIYRLLGGVVLRRPGQDPMYAGYIASAFLLQKGSNNNRVVAPGSEDLNGPLGEKARFYLVGLRPGTAYAVGSTFRPAIQIDPILPVSIRFTLTYPDGRQQVSEGVGDRFGSYAGATAWPLDVAGVYRYQIRATWNGFEGRMPGLPESGGEFFVYSPKLAGATGLRIDGASQRTFSAASSTTITGTSSARFVHYTLITPGAVIEQGDVEVSNGRFQYVFNPVAVHQKVPLYDITSITTGKPQIGRVIHLTFFSEEKSGGGAFFDVTRVILRGTTVIAAKPAVSTTLALGGLPADTQTVGFGMPDRLARLAAGPVRIDAATSTAVRDWDGWLDALVRSGDLVVVSRENDTMLAGRTHERLRQYYRGVPVVGAEVTIQADGGGAVSMFGTIHPGIRLDVAPAVSAEDAARIAARVSGGQVGSGQAPDLVVLPLDEGGYRLAWRTETRSVDDVRASFVDAVSGRMLLDYSEMRDQAPQVQAGRGRVDAVDFRGDSARTFLEVASGEAPGIPGAQDAAIEEDAAVVAARTAINATRDYFVRRAGRFVLDAQDAPVPVVVHPVSLADWDRLGSTHARYFAGAFWDGRMIVLGEGTPAAGGLDGRAWANAAESRDLVAHELAHAVLDRSARLIYRGESGALAEAFADIVAAGVHFAATSGSADAAVDGYLIGDDATIGGVRSMRDPAKHGNPDHYRAVARGVDVHASSTIVSHAFYLAIEGGTNRTSGLAVEGAGAAHRDEVERVFYRAFVYMLPSGASFATARAATVQSARDLYGAESRTARAVAQAWAAVGVR